MHSKKKIQWAWSMYDWANSVHSLSVATALFPIYWSNITGGEEGIVNLFGIAFKSSSLYAFSLSFAFLFIALINPLLSGIADTKGNKKTFMRVFVLIGGFSCMGMYFFDETTIPLGLLTFILSVMGYAGSLVFYNAYLPEIASAKEYDKLSAKGFAMGYVGCVILLVLNLVVISNFETFGLDSKLHAIRVSFASVGVWWISFSFIPFHYLPDNTKPKVKFSILAGYSQSLKILKKVMSNGNMKLFLTSFFFYAMGVQTIMYLATLFGTEEIKMDEGNLIMTVLLIQILGIVGAYFYAWMASKIGGVRTLVSILMIWILVCVLAYFTYTEYAFYGIAILVGFVMGGVQSMSRSTYTKFLPKQEEHNSYYSFYELTEKLAIVMGTFSYGFIDQITGSMRNSIFALSLFFATGMVFLLILRKRLKTHPIKAAE
jgi:UMF1 family MFS transporter